MHVLTNPLFVANGLIVRLALSTSDEWFEVSFSVDTGFQQIFTVRLHESEGTALIWEAHDNRTFAENKVKDEDLHAALRAYISSVLPELMLRGFMLKGSYRYKGKRWNVNPVQTESIDLPDLEPVA